MFASFIKINYFPVNEGFLFSRNADIPSSASEVAKHRPKDLASKCKPVSISVSLALLIDILASFKAIAIQF